MKKLSLFALLALLVASPFVASESAPRPGKAAIASAHGLATDAGFEILQAGGNAFDAAIAVSAALAVVEPSSSGLGGGGFWLIERPADNNSVMIDGREKAPAAATRDMYVENGVVNRMKAVSGPLSAGIPGEAAALAYLAENYGRLTLAQCLEPAIRLATEGFPVDEKYRTLMGRLGNRLRFSPEARKIFLADGEVPELGHIIKQPDLASVLQRLASGGHAGFYSGETAEKVVAGVREADGIWTLADMANYQIAVREPIRFQYGDWKIITAPPPSSGGVALASILNIIEGYKLSEFDSVKRYHVLTEAMRRAYRDRSIYLGDPDFVDVPVERLSSDLYAAGLRAGIRLDKATPSDMLPGIEVAAESTDTTHFSLIDAAGNKVAATLTINLPYGSGFVAPGTGFLLNDEMDDFSAKDGVPNAYGLIGANANAIEPNKRPLSSMTPTIAESESAVGILGTPGGSRIITMVLLGILELSDGEPPEAWVDLPRIHHQYLPDILSVEPNALTDEELAALEAMGHTVQVRDRTWGNMHGVLWNKKTGEVAAASDKRWASGRARVGEPE